MLVRDGYAGLTFRRVAAECNLHVGNLPYHFPTKQALVIGLLEAVLSAYEERAAQLTHLLPGDDKVRFKAVVVNVLRDIQTLQTTRFFPELWSMANYDDIIAERLQEFYRRARAPTIALLQRLNPLLDEHDAETLCIFFSSLAEGSTIFAGHGKPYADRMADISALAIRSFMEIAENITPGELHSLRAEWEKAPAAAPWVPGSFLENADAD